MTARAGRQLTDLLNRAEHQMSRRLSAALQDEGLTLDQWRVLTLLADRTGHTMSDIADHVLLPPATLTRLIDRMVEDNLIYRRGDLEDRRRIRVFLASRGRSLYQRVAAIIEREETALTAELGDDEREVLADLLSRLAGRD